MSRSAVTILTHSPEQTAEVGAALAGLLREGDTLAIDGPLGAGKTALVRALAEALGIDPREVSSPTFVVVCEHLSPRGIALVHADAYRLTGPSDLESVGWDRAADGSAIVVVEWAERLGAALGDPAFVGRLRLVPIGATSRRIELDVPAAWTMRGQWGAIAALAGRARACPVCGKDAHEPDPAFPFCSERCRGADLSRWLSGQYAIPGEEPTPPEDA